MKRLPYLSSHLRGLNRSVSSERKQFWRLYPLCVSILALSFGYCWVQEKKAGGVSLKPCPLSYPSDGSKTRIRGSNARESALPSESVRLLWRQESQGGIKLNGSEGNLSFEL